MIHRVVAVPWCIIPERQLRGVSYTAEQTFCQISLRIFGKNPNRRSVPLMGPGGNTVFDEKTNTKKSCDTVPLKSMQHKIGGHSLEYVLGNLGWIVASVFGGMMCFVDLSAKESKYKFCEINRNLQKYVPPLWHHSRYTVSIFI